MDEQTFLDLINKSMQDSAERVQSLTGRTPSRVTREQALKQVAMLQQAKEEWEKSLH